MNSTLPQPITKQPSREGLAYYECLADGIIHAAVVFNIDQDIYFVERVAALAWVNGASAVYKKVQHSAKLAQTLHQVLETGRSQTIALCKAVETAVVASTCAFAGIRQYYKTLGTRAISSVRPEQSGVIRRLVAEAILAGLSCRGAAPKLYQAIAERASQTSGEQNFLGAMLIGWLDTDGLPIQHPFLQMAAAFYRKKSHERRLIGELMSTMLMTDIEHAAFGGMWRHNEWLETGWKMGVNQSVYAPDTVQPLFEEAGKDHLGYCKELYRDCISPSQKPDQPIPDLPAAFDIYVQQTKDCSFHFPKVRSDNPRLLAARAFDFAVWMGFLASK